MNSFLPYQATMKQTVVEFPPSPPKSVTEEDGELALEVNSLKLKIPLPPPSTNPTKVLEIDSKTPDWHVPRDSRLIRLTGTHPFNVEAPLSTLFEQGFLTPPELFYVRNHGAVPQVFDHEIPDWEITVEGLVENPLTLSFRQVLSEFPQVTLPITLVCAGNRRKEQNMVRKTQGFSWGSAGLSTSLFTGPLLADIIRAARPRRGARYVCMEGADQLPNGNYGTSVKLNWVMDYNRGIMLAHKMNGEPLRPDHGKPIRVVVPGQIGGRSVKWLKRLIVSDQPSDNWYHKFDNRVLPTMITPEASKQDLKWWNDERYAIYDLSVNSAVAQPAHGEKLPICSIDYTIRGYAYSGGTRRVSRVEVSFDKGKTWQLAEIDYPEDLYRDVGPENSLFGGRLDMSDREGCFCWCFWHLDVPVSTLSEAEDFVVRAMDDSMSAQPRDMYWSVLGMMHNAWFRIAIRKEGDMLVFEHPTQLSMKATGWMDRVKNEGGDFMNGNWGEKIKGLPTPPSTPREVKEVSMVNESVKRLIDIDELRKHDNAESPWFVVNGEVYDGKPFLKDHPGGAQSIISSAGLDASEEFLAIHSESAKIMMPEYHIGSLNESAREILKSGSDGEDTSDDTVFLNPRAWKSSKLVSKEVVSWDTRIFTFRLDKEDQPLGLPVGQHILVKTKEPKTGDAIIRAYTPLSRPSKTGVVELLVKVYFNTPSARGGRMTMALDALPMGQNLEFKGPLGKLEYLGQGRVRLSGSERTVTSFLMICGGSGLTPIYQVLRAVLEDPQDSTQCVVLDGNRLEEDILCKKELDQFAVGSADRLRLVYTLTKATVAWTGRRGRVDRELIEREMPKGQRPLCLICGPESLEKSVHGILGELGFGDDEMVFF